MPRSPELNRAERLLATVLAPTAIEMLTELTAEHEYPEPSEFEAKRMEAQIAASLEKYIRELREPGPQPTLEDLFWAVEEMLDQVEVDVLGPSPAMRAADEAGNR